MMWKKGVVAGVLFLFLLWFWPNFVHEPLHLLALKVQGVPGQVNFDMSLPAHPSTTRLGELSGVVGGLFFLLLPSVVSVLLLWVILRTRANAGLLSHVVPAVYLTFDLLINILKNGSPSSDFHFLVVLPGVVKWSMVIGVLAFGMWVTLRSMARFRSFQEMMEGVYG